MSIASRSIGLTVMALMLIWALGSTGSMVYFWDLPSALWIAGLLVGGLWASFGPRRVVKALAIGLGAPADSDSIRTSAAVLGRGVQLGWAGGLLGVFAGVITMLQNMSDPAMIGPGIAVALLPLFYGVTVAELTIEPLRQSLLARGEEAGAEPAPEGPRRMLVALGVMAFSLVVMVAWMGSV